MNRKHGDMGDELLNAYLDEQLDADERGRLLQALREDQELAERVCALRQVKELTRHAYDDLAPDPETAPAPPQRGRGARGIAAALSLMVAGAAAGWWGHQQWPETVAPTRMLQLEEVTPERLLAAAQQSNRVVLHVSSNQPQRLTAALDTVDRLLQRSELQRNRLELEVIVNSQGLDLLRADTTAHAERISTLAGRFRNVHFLACSKAVERLRREGLKVDLLPEARIEGPALELILKRMREGWLYVEA